MTTLTDTAATTTDLDPVDRLGPTDATALLPPGVVHPAGRGRPRVGLDLPTPAVQDVLDADAWPTRPTDVWTRVERDRALARFTSLKVLVTEHGCVVARTTEHSLAGADAGRERWPPSPAAA